MSDRMPPRNHDAERSLIGCWIHDPATIDDCHRIVKVTDFYDPRHEAVAATLLMLRADSRPIDAVTLMDELQRRGEYDRCDALDLIPACMDAGFQTANAAYYAGIVAQLATTRRLIEAATLTLSECYARNHTAGELLERAESRILAIGDRAGGSGPELAGAGVPAALDRMERRGQGELTGVPSGLGDLDEITDGFHPGQLVIVGGRPAMGKTSLALTFAEYAALDIASHVLIVSLEMAKPELDERLVVMRSMIDGHRARTGKLDPGDWDAVRRAGRAIEACDRLWIDDGASATPEAIMATARRHKARHGLDLLLVDYMQLVHPPADMARRANRQEQVTAISRRFKGIARDLRIPVIVLSQLNRQVEGREGNRPRMSDVRESGAIENDADMILLIHRPDYYDPNDKPGVAELIVAKNRNGRTGSVELAYLKPQMRFADLAPAELVADTEPF